MRVKREHGTMDMRTPEARRDFAPHPDAHPAIDGIALPSGFTKLEARVMRMAASYPAWFSLAAAADVVRADYANHLRESTARDVLAQLEGRGLVSLAPGHCGRNRFQLTGCGAKLAAQLIEAPSEK